MRIVIGIHSLAGMGGVESYTTTIGDHLQRAGHEVWIYAAEGGATADVAGALGLRVVLDVNDLPGELDVAIVQDTISALELLDARPSLPQIFIWHGELFDVSLPPQLDGATRLIVTLSHRAYSRVGALAVGAPLLNLQQPVDTQRFRPLAVLGEVPRKAVSLGNYLQGEQMQVLERACERAGIELEFVGLHGSQITDRAEHVINAADIVFGKSRVIIEAMASGRAAFVLDAFGVDGWVTSETFEQLRADSFAGTLFARSLDEDDIVADLENYSASMGAVNRDLIMPDHNATAHTAELASAIREAIDHPVDAMVHDGTYELARMSRVNWRHESNAYRLGIQLERMSLAKGDIEWRLEQANAELVRERERADSADRTTQKVLNSRRWRLLQWLMKPLDRTRGRV